ncbi:MAG TPA: transporter substrate-binding domain-containing protein [Kiritimatiellia bacterium]|nr:transporter substrate-binding domain-containing protein [Kiritimatiellia bacterium]HRZ12722.1 transporter substrate-binding domain-containing protein [Kiritimatiellia bacterium]HSA18326.1 transporter substrate-binding domain-containing protein [Kiritimatiellia bacterium]
MRKRTQSGAVVAMLFAACAAAAVEPPVLSGCEYDYPPYCVVKPDGQADGFSVELLRAALAAMGREVTFKAGPWSELKQDLAEGRLQALPLVGRAPERESMFDFTFPYLPVHGTILVRTDNADIRTTADLKGRSVAVLKGDNAEDYLRRSDFGATIVPLSSFETALRELSAGQHDAVVIQKLVAFQLMRQAGITNLQAVGPPLKDFTQSLCFAVREGDAALLDTLNEGLSIVIADGTFRRLHAKWFAEIEAEGLLRSRIVVGGDNAYPPYEFLDENGRPAGFNVDLTRAIARRMGLSVDIRLDTWATVRAGLESGELDVLQGMFYSAERTEKVSFSPPHSIVHHAAAVRRGAPLPRGLPDLKGLALFVQNRDIMHDWAVAQGLGGQVQPVDSQETALGRLHAGAGDAALVSVVQAQYWMKRHGWTGLDVSDVSLLSPEYCYGVRRGHEPLLALFSEGLAALKESGEYRQIQARWLGPYDASGVPLRRVLALVLVALALAAFFAVLGVLFRRQVGRRTAELRASESLWRSYVESAPYGIYISDARGRLVQVNPEASQITGYNRDELTALELEDLVAPESRKAALRDFARLKESGEVRGEYAFVTKGGETRWWAVAGAKLTEDRYLGYANDVTDRRAGEKLVRDAQAETQRLLEEARQARRALLSLVEDQRLGQEQLQALSERQDALLSAIPDIVMEVDANKVYTWANRAGLEFFGPDVVGREARYYFEGEQDTYRRVQPLFDGKSDVIYLESLQRRHDGQKRLLAWWCRTLKDGQGRVTGAISTARDITDQKNLEDQFRQAQKIDAVGRLAGGVAHDFNNMLGVILGHAEMALEQIKPTQPVYEDLQEIQRAAQRSADLTRQLLAFARKQTVEPRVLNLNETVSGMLKMLRRLIGEDIELVWQPGANLWSVCIDPVQVDQILANLAVNARDAIRGVGQLTICTENVALRSEDLATHPDAMAGEYILLKVGDNGAGMDPVTQAHLFEPFFTTKGLGKGTGLGLATIYGVVKQNHGFIDVDSRPGRGTSFNIYLPRALEDETTEPAKEGPSSVRGTETILFVEDSESLVKLVTTLLKKRGYNVLAAGLPSSALDMVRQYPKPIHLLIADVIMPGMNGRDMADRIRALRPDIRVIYMSGYTADVIAHHGVLEPGVDFLQKPVSGKMLLAKIREVLDRKPGAPGTESTT